LRMERRAKRKGEEHGAAYCFQIEKIFHDFTAFY
jgi:guanylate kinase